MSLPSAAAPVEIIGAGGFGAVFRPALPNNEGGVEKTYPGNVTKLFFRKPDRNRILTMAPHLTTIIGPNEGFRINPYAKTYKAKNLDRSLVDKLKEKSPALGPENEVYPVRMPNLGLDISRLSSNPSHIESLRNVPFINILKQIQKLIHQIERIDSNGFAHFDIRPSNVMVNPDTGVMTLLDFDWLKPIPEIYATYGFGFPSNPPEALFKKDADEITLGMFRLRTEQELIDRLQSDRFMFDDYSSYAMGFMYNFPKAFKLRGILHRALPIESHNVAGAVFQANVKNYFDFKSGATSDEEIKKRFINWTIRSTDVFGLGFTLLELIANVYPFYPRIDYEPTDPIAFSEIVKRTLKNNGKEYTDIEALIISESLKSLLVTLGEMTQFKTKLRHTHAKARKEIDHLIRAYQEVSATLAAGVGSSSGADANAGKTRRARRRTRNNRRQN